MPADTVLVIDAGTSALRAVAVRMDGDVRCIAAEGWRPFGAVGDMGFAREFEPRDVEAAVARLLDACAVERGRVAGIVTTGQREGVAFLGREGRCVFASPNIDARAAAEGMAIDAQHGRRVYETTGHLPSLLLAPAKLAWLRANRPDAAMQVRCVLPLADWIAALLTGVPAMSRSLAAEIGVLDVRSGRIASQLLADTGLACDLLPPLLADGAVSGTVRQGALAGVPVVLGGADTQCALAGMAVLDAGQIGIAAGSTAPLQLVTKEPHFDGAQRTWTGLHVAAGRWVLESNAGEAERVLDWLCGLLKVTVAEGDALAAQSPPGARDALAVLGPRAMDAGRMNAGIGALTVPLPVLMSAPSPGDLLRSVLESLAFAMRANVEQLERVGGVQVDLLALGGGMSASALFTQMLADVLGRPVEVARSPQTTPLGAAVVAAPALGLHGTLELAAAALAGPRHTLHPDLRTSAIYDDVYARWDSLGARFEANPP